MIKLTDILREVQDGLNPNLTKNVNIEFEKVSKSKWNTFDMTLGDIVKNWKSVQNDSNHNIQTIKYFVDNPDRIHDMPLIYDDRGLSDGYHRITAMKILNIDKFTYIIDDGSY